MDDARQWQGGGRTGQALAARRASGPRSCGKPYGIPGLVLWSEPSPSCYLAHDVVPRPPVTSSLIMRRRDLSGRQLPPEPVRVVRRSLRHVVGTVLGLLLGTLLVLTAVLALLRWHGQYARVRRWELWRQKRFYHLHLETDGTAVLGARRGILVGLVAGGLGYVMFDLLLLVLGIVLGSLQQTLLGRPVMFTFDLWVISRPALPVLLIFGTSSLLATDVYAEVAVAVQAALLRCWSPVVREDALESRISRLLTTRRRGVSKRRIRDGRRSSRNTS